jgi:TPR repeat protein
MVDLLRVNLFQPVGRAALNALRCGALALGFVLAFGALAQAQQPATFQDGLAKMEAGQVNEAVAIWATLAQQGQLEALYALGLVFESGAPGIVPDAMQAADFYQRAADGGLAEAQTNLGLLYAEGRGVIESQEKAVALWLKAARKNNAIAQFNLGLAYFSGRGIEQDTPEALGLILVAALQGLPQAHYAIGQFYLRGLGLEENRSLALAFLQQAKLGGHAAADAFVSELIADGVLEADLNDPSVQAVLPRLPRLLAQKAIPEEPAAQAQPQAAQTAVTVPRLPQQGQGAPSTTVPSTPATRASAGGQNPLANPEAPEPLPLQQGASTPQAATAQPQGSPAQAGTPQAGASQAGASLAGASQAETPSNPAFSTFDGSAPLIDPTALSKGALNVGGLQLGQVDTDLLRPDPNLSLGSPAVPAPRGVLDLPLTLDDGQEGSGLGSGILGGTLLGGGGLGGKLPGTAVLQDGANSNALRIQPNSRLFNQTPAGDLLAEGANQDANPVANLGGVPAPLPLAGDEATALQVPQNQASPQVSPQVGQSDQQRFGPLRSAVPGANSVATAPPATAAQPAVPQQSGNASFQPTPEGLMLLVGPKPQGAPFVLWIGTAATSKEGAELWLAALKAEPSILNGLEAILEPATIGKTTAFRVLVGPIPDEKLGWQVCNAVKAGKMTFFCKVRAF